MCAGALIAISVEAQALKFYLAYNHDNPEAYNQAWGVVTAFENLTSKKIPVEDLNTKTLTSSEIKDKIEHDLSKEKVVFIGAGEEAIAGMRDLPQDPNLVMALVASSPLENHKDKKLLDKVDFIALPGHVAQTNLKEQLGEKLIETPGVVHNRRPDMTTYDEYQKELPQADIYLGVYLGGDMSITSQETENDATRLADYITEKAKELDQGGLTPCVLVLNKHREEKPERLAERFIQRLADKGIEYKILDFQPNAPKNEKQANAYDAFDLVAGAVRSTKGKMFVPGDATIIISEAIDVLPSEAIETMPPGKVLVYHTAAMNDVHKTHIANEKERGRVSVLENYENILPASDTAEAQPNASKVVAQKLVEVVSHQAPWTAEESLYRQVKKKESEEKIKQNFIANIEMQHQIKLEKNPHLSYDFMGELVKF